MKEDIAHGLGLIAEQLERIANKLDELSYEGCLSVYDQKVKK